MLYYIIATAPGAEIEHPWKSSSHWTEIQTLLERTESHLTEWQRSQHGAVSGEHAGNLPSGTCQKSTL